MKYISVDFRVRIIEAYKKLNQLQLSDEELDQELFGNPEMRAAVDEAIDAADEEIDKERFQQFSVEWFYYVAERLPKLPKKTLQYDLSDAVEVDDQNEIREAAEQLLVAQKNFIFSLLKVLGK